MRFSFKKSPKFLGGSPFFLGFEAGKGHFGAPGVFMWRESAESEANTGETGTRRWRLGPPYIS